MMALPRVSRHGISCPDCGSNRRSKHSFNQGMQRCTVAGTAADVISPAGLTSGPEPAVKERALPMYAEGSRLRAIGRVLGHSAPAVLGWVKKGAPGPEPTAGAEPAAHQGEGGPSFGGGGVLG